MNYNTKLKKLGLPEYGRNIQNMVDYCVALPDKEARRRCADAIIHTMGNLFPYLRDIDDFKSILWNHLAIMSDFKLDIDYPCEVIKKENLYSKPPRIPYNSSTFRYRHYGKIIEEMINKANEMEAGEKKDRLVYLLANQMKKSYVTWNKDSVEDKKIFLDLGELSANRIQLQEGDMKLAEVREIQQVVQVRKNPKNNNRKKNHPRRNK